MADSAALPVSYYIQSNIEHYNIFLCINRKRNNVSVMDDEKLRGRFKVINAERNFIIEKTDVDDFGNYTCELKGVVKEIHVICKYSIKNQFL